MCFIPYELYAHNDKVILEKCRKVVESCKTEAHFASAINYCELARKVLTFGDSKQLVQNYKALANYQKHKVSNAN